MGTFSPKLELDDGDIDDELDPAMKEELDRFGGCAKTFIICNGGSSCFLSLTALPNEGNIKTTHLLS